MVRVSFQTVANKNCVDICKVLIIFHWDDCYKVLIIFHEMTVIKY